MPTTLKNGMFVTPPISNEYLTEGKRYEVSNVNPSEFYGYSFVIITDDGHRTFVKLNQSRHINNLNWKIVEL